MDEFARWDRLILFGTSMTKELKLDVGFRYVSSLHESLFSRSDVGLQSVIVLVFFPTYVVFQPLAIVLCRKLGPRKFLASIAFLWGATEMVGNCLASIASWSRLILFSVSALSPSGLICSGFVSCLESSNRAFIQVSCICSRLGILDVSKLFLVASSALLISTFRRCRQAIQLFLLDWCCCTCVWGDLSIWLDANGWTCR